uniref:Uncharacterized protein n=1 Tax=Arion vulgaris TaxID=1028688 RepID=A0A0B7AJL1_9EUPU
MYWHWQDKFTNTTQILLDLNTQNCTNTSSSSNLKLQQQQNEAYKNKVEKLYK